MAKKSLQELSIPELSKILDEFGQKQVVFQSEAQFQFELAWRLQEVFDCKVKLEDLTVLIKKTYKHKNGKDKTQLQKVYTDIVLEKNDYRVAIELKYKTAELKYGDVIVFNHGATDLGRYDYLWDVNRVELLVHKDVKIAIEQSIAKELDCDVEYTISKQYNAGFAVLLTNDNDYWTQNHNMKNTIDKQFCIGQDDISGKGQLYSKVLNWKLNERGEYPKTVAESERARRIELTKAYTYKWEPLCNVPQKDGKNGEFKYLIIECNN